MTAAHPPFDLDAAVAALIARTGAGRPGVAIIALAWATVDTDRAVDELRAHGPFGAALSEPLLGASCRVGRRAPVRLAIVEPSTEGRLTASLARHDEGPVALWATTTGGSDLEGVRLSTAANGPFGPERLVLGSPPWGPHLLVIGPSAGTIDR